MYENVGWMRTVFRALTGSGIKRFCALRVPSLVAPSRDRSELCCSPIGSCHTTPRFLRISVFPDHSIELYIVRFGSV